MLTFNDFINEMAGTFAIVGCEDNPNFQVWGARSDMNCKKKKKNKVLKMKFKDWVELKEQDQKIDLKTFFNRFKKGNSQQNKQIQNNQQSQNKNIQNNQIRGDKVVNNGQ